MGQKTQLASLACVVIVQASDQLAAVALAVFRRVLDVRMSGGSHRGAGRTSV
jgi:hypothetical protein